MRRIKRRLPRGIMTAALLAGLGGIATALTFISSTRFETGNAVIPSSGGSPASTQYRADGSRTGVTIPRLVVSQPGSDVRNWEEY